jgi:PIN domain nuclease of toxin-antitoxin system
LRILLDTHALLWALSAPGKLPVAVRRAVQAPENEVYASLASAWEIAIKVALGRLEFDLRSLEDTLAASGIQTLGISLEHTVRVANLPPHHRDPFDRMLVAQALCESLTLASRDRVLSHYGVRTIWARETLVGPRGA